MGSPRRIGIIGATGYVGMELVRLIALHPEFKLTRLVSRSYQGQLFSDIYPGFMKTADIRLTASDPDDLAQACDFVITALPHGVSSEQVPLLLDKGLRVIDHSGDFRYRDLKDYQAAYKLAHTSSHLLSEAVYGLPEIYRQQISKARLVANPGCYPTCSLLALMPVLKHNLVEKDNMIIDAVSGVSGAGRKAELAFSFCETESSFKAYGAVGHRHTSEIEQEASLMTGFPGSVKLTFTPHLAPMKRGMLATVYARLKPDKDAKSIQQAFSSFYDNEFFIRQLPDGRLPETRHVTYTNFCDLAWTLDAATGMLKIFSAIDNLGKGAAAQAVQSLNCMAELPETMGLISSGGSV